MAPVFGAFGASTMDIRQVWDISRTIRLFRWDRLAYLDDLESFNHVVRELKALSVRDLRLEGFSEDRMGFRLELDMRYGSQHNLTKVVAPRLILQGEDDVRELCDRFTKLYSDIYSPEAAFPVGGINIECFYLAASVRQERPEFRSEAPAGEQPSPSARIGSRLACFDPAIGMVETPVFGWLSLAPGNVISGPSLIEAPGTTYVIEPGWSYRMDAWRNGILQQQS
jgi:N-methylhydantoinase A/acetophenone carboxylase